MSPARRHIVMLGLMASGKSTVGRLVAARLGRRLEDNDEGLTRLVGHSAAQHADRHGMPALHQLEAQVLRASIEQPEPAVITAAASVGDRRDLPDLVGPHFAVWLDVDPLVLASRVPPHGDHRPLGDEAVAQLQEQRTHRSSNFRAAADLVVTWHHETPDELAHQVLEAFGAEVS